MNTKIINIEQNLKTIISKMGNVIVAYSGGVDSSYLMDVSSEVLGNNAIAIMSFSPSVAEDDRTDAIKLAKSKKYVGLNSAIPLNLTPEKETRFLNVAKLNDAEF